MNNNDIEELMTQIRVQNVAMPDIKATFDKMYKIDPDLVKRTQDFVMASLDPVISGKLVNLVYLGVDLIRTHLLPYGAREHTRMALEDGATVREIVEAMGIVAFASASAYEVGLPLIRRISARLNSVTKPPQLTAAQETLKEKLAGRMGYWPEWMDEALALSPDYLNSLVELGYPAPREDGLDRKTRELILLAIHACPALNNLRAMERHAEQALIHGATEQELLAIIRLCNIVGCHSIFIGVEAASEHLAQDVGGTRVARMWLGKPDS